MTEFPWEEEAASGGAPEAAEAANAPDVPDAVDALDAPDTTNAPEPPDTSEVSESSGSGEVEGAAAGAVMPRRSEGGTRPLVRKEYYSISDVADLVGLPAHVLRYWESQFAVLNPSKNRSGNRVYQRKEIRLILLVKQLLYEEKYTVEGAKQRLDQLRKAGSLQEATSHALDEQMVQVLREELQSLATLLAPGRS